VPEPILDLLVGAHWIIRGPKVLVAPRSVIFLAGIAFRAAATLIRLARAAPPNQRPRAALSPDTDGVPTAMLGAMAAVPADVALAAIEREGWPKRILLGVAVSWPCRPPRCLSSVWHSRHSRSVPFGGSRPRGTRTDLPDNLAADDNRLAARHPPAKA